MKIGCFSVLLGGKPLKDALKIIKDLGCEAVEIGTGNYPGNAHCDPEKLLKSPDTLKEFQQIVKNSGLEISALSCHGNPIHPSKEIATQHTKVHEATVQLAEKLGVKVVVGFSGCPGAGLEAKVPAWNVIGWPPDYPESLKWQWEQVAIPFWKKQADFAEKHNVKIAFEPHPGFLVYNTETVLRIRKECGKVLGANLDPSHLFWQMMDPLKVVRALGDAIFHVHAKDCKIDPANTELNGVNDPKNYAEEIKRSWIFRSVGYGHDLGWWKEFISQLRLIGYDSQNCGGVLSIEHEDSLMDGVEGLKAGYSTLRQAIIVNKPGPAFWA